MQDDRLRVIMRRLGVQNLAASHSGWLHGMCPLAPYTHRAGRDRHPSFAVKPETDGVSAYMCWTCKHHGRISSLVRLLHHHGADVGETPNDYPSLAHEADKADMDSLGGREYRHHEQQEDPLPDPLDECIFEGMFMPAFDVPEARDYLLQRGVNETAAMAMELGWDPDQRRVVFPVRGRGSELYGFTGRSVVPDAEPKIRDYHGLPKRHLVLGENRWLGQPMDSRPLVVVEGLFAYAHLVDMGLEAYADVGALLGSTMTDGKAARIMAQGGPVYLLLDNDEGGDTGLFGREDPEGNRDFDAGAIGMLQHHVPLYVPAWPINRYDPDELTRGEVWAMLKDTQMYSAGGTT